MIFRFVFLQRFIMTPYFSRAFDNCPSDPTVFLSSSMFQNVSRLHGNRQVIVKHVEMLTIEFQETISFVVQDDSPETCIRAPALLLADSTDAPLDTYKEA